MEHSRPRLLMLSALLLVVLMFTDVADGIPLVRTTPCVDDTVLVTSATTSVMLAGGTRCNVRLCPEDPFATWVVSSAAAVVINTADFVDSAITICRLRINSTKPLVIDFGNSGAVNTRTSLTLRDVHALPGVAPVVLRASLGSASTLDVSNSTLDTALLNAVDGVTVGSINVSTSHFQTRQHFDGVRLVGSPATRFDSVSVTHCTFNWTMAATSAFSSTFGLRLPDDAAAVGAVVFSGNAITLPNPFGRNIGVAGIGWHPNMSVPGATSKPILTGSLVVDDNTADVMIFTDEENAWSSPRVSVLNISIGTIAPGSSVHIRNNTVTNINRRKTAGTTLAYVELGPTMVSVGGIAGPSRVSVVVANNTADFSTGNFSYRHFAGVMLHFLNHTAAAAAPDADIEVDVSIESNLLLPNEGEHSNGKLAEISGDVAPRHHVNVTLTDNAIRATTPVYRSLWLLHQNLLATNGGGGSVAIQIRSNTWDCPMSYGTLLQLLVPWRNRTIEMAGIAITDNTQRTTGTTVGTYAFSTSAVHGLLNVSGDVIISRNTLAQTWFVASFCTDTRITGRLEVSDHPPMRLLGFVLGSQLTNDTALINLGGTQYSGRDQRFIEVGAIVVRNNGVSGVGASMSLVRVVSQLRGIGASSAISVERNTFSVLSVGEGFALRVQNNITGFSQLRVALNDFNVVVTREHQPQGHYVPEAHVDSSAVLSFKTGATEDPSTTVLVSVAEIAFTGNRMALRPAADQSSVVDFAADVVECTSVRIEGDAGTGHASPIGAGLGTIADPGITNHLTTGRSSARCIVIASTGTTVRPIKTASDSGGGRVAFHIVSTACLNENTASGTAGIAIIGAVVDTDIVVDGSTIEVHGRVFPSAAFVALPSSRFYGTASVRISNSTLDMSRGGGQQVSGVTVLSINGADPIPSDPMAIGRLSSFVIEGTIIELPASAPSANAVYLRHASCFIDTVVFRRNRIALGAPQAEGAVIAVLSGLHFIRTSFVVEDNNATATPSVGLVTFLSVGHHFGHLGFPVLFAASEADMPPTGTTAAQGPLRELRFARNRFVVPGVAGEWSETSGPGLGLYSLVNITRLSRQPDLPDWRATISSNVAPAVATAVAVPDCGAAETLIRGNIVGLAVGAVFADHVATLQVSRSAVAVGQPWFSTTGTRHACILSDAEMSGGRSVVVEGNVFTWAPRGAIKAPAIGVVSPLGAQGSLHFRRNSLHSYGATCIDDDGGGSSRIPDGSFHRTSIAPRRAFQIGGSFDVQASVVTGLRNDTAADTWPALLPWLWEVASNTVCVALGPDVVSVTAVVVTVDAFNVATAASGPANASTPLSVYIPNGTIHARSNRVMFDPPAVPGPSSFTSSKVFGMQVAGNADLPAAFAATLAAKTLRSIVFADNYMRVPYGRDVTAREVTVASLALVPGNPSLSSVTWPVMSIAVDGNRAAFADSPSPTPSDIADGSAAFSVADTAVDRIASLRPTQVVNVTTPQFNVLDAAVRCNRLETGPLNAVLPLRPIAPGATATLLDVVSVDDSACSSSRTLSTSHVTPSSSMTVSPSRSDSKPTITVATASKSWSESDTDPSPTASASMTAPFPVLVAEALVNFTTAVPDVASGSTPLRSFELSEQDALDFGRATRDPLAPSEVSRLRLRAQTANPAAFVDDIARQLGHGSDFASRWIQVIALNASATAGGDLFDTTIDNGARCDVELEPSTEEPHIAEIPGVRDLVRARRSQQVTELREHFRSLRANVTVLSPWIALLLVPHALPNLTAVVDEGAGDAHFRVHVRSMSRRCFQRQTKFPDDDMLRLTRPTTFAILMPRGADVPSAVVSPTVVTVTTVATATSAVAGSSSGGGVMARTMIIGDIADCGTEFSGSEEQKAERDEADERQPIVSSPMQLRLAIGGTDGADYMLGMAVGNLVFVALVSAAFLCLGVGYAFVRDLDITPEDPNVNDPGAPLWARTGALRSLVQRLNYSRQPSVAAFPVAFLLEPTVNGIVGSMVHPAATVVARIIAFVLLLVTIGIAVGAARYMFRPLRDRAAFTRSPPVPDAPPGSTFETRAGVALKRFFRPLGEWDDTAKPIVGAAKYTYPSYVRMCFLYFADYSDAFPWFFAVEALVAALLACASVYIDAYDGCVGGNVLVLIIMAGYFAVMLKLKPYESHFQAAFAALTTGLQLAATVLSLIYSVSHASALQLGVEVLLFCVAGLVLLRAVFDVVMVVIRAVLYRLEQKRRKEAAGFANADHDKLLRDGDADDPLSALMLGDAGQATPQQSELPSPLPQYQRPDSAPSAPRAAGPQPPLLSSTPLRRAVDRSRGYYDGDETSCSPADWGGEAGISPSPRRPDDGSAAPAVVVPAPDPARRGQRAASLDKQFRAMLLLQQDLEAERSRKAKAVARVRRKLNGLDDDHDGAAAPLHTGVDVPRGALQRPMSGAAQLRAALGDAEEIAGDMDDDGADGTSSPYRRADRLRVVRPQPRPRRGGAAAIPIDPADI